MNLSALLPLLSQKPYYQELIHEVNDGQTLRKTLIIPEAVKPFVIASLHHDLNSPIVVITSHPDGARKLYDEVQLWAAHPETILYFPEAGFLPENYIAPDTMVLNDRIKALSALVNLRNRPANSKETAFLIVTHASAASGHIISPEEFSKSNMTVSIRNDR